MAMQENEWPDFDRAPIDPLKKLCTDGLLRPVMRLNGLAVGRKAALDVHFRGSEIHVYCGHARVFRIRLLQQEREVEVEMGRADGQSATDRRAADADPSDLEDALNRHLRSVNVDGIVKGEGILQARWAGLGHGDEAGRPWTTIDREVQLSYPDKDVRAKAEERIDLAVSPARRTINEIANRPPRWRLPPDTGGRLDQLAVDEDGNLVLVEIKDAGSGSDLYYAPLQVLRYVHLWHVSLRRLALWERVRALVDARRACLLTPNIPSLSGGIRAAVCFGSFGDKPSEPSEEVKRRFYEVMGVVNAHVPHGVPPIETWKYDEHGEPEPL